MNRIFLAILIVIFGLGVTAFIRLSTPDTNVISDGSEGDDGMLDDLFEDNDKNDGGSSDGGVVNNNLASSITQEVLSQHNKQNDCWVAYDGKVYDVTSFLPRHPGSAGAIAPHCGTYESFTKAFEGQHGKSKVSNLMKVGTLMGDFQIQGKI